MFRKTYCSGISILRSTKVDLKMIFHHAHEPPSHSPPTSNLTLSTSRETFRCEGEKFLSSIYLHISITFLVSIGIEQQQLHSLSTPSLHKFHFFDRRKCFHETIFLRFSLDLQGTKCFRSVIFAIFIGKLLLWWGRYATEFRCKRCRSREAVATLTNVNSFTYLHIRVCSMSQSEAQESVQAEWSGNIFLWHFQYFHCCIRSWNGIFANREFSAIVCEGNAQKMWIVTFEEWKMLPLMLNQLLVEESARNILHPRKSSICFSLTPKFNLFTENHSRLSAQFGNVWRRNVFPFFFSIFIHFSSLF